jgi:two-component system response regulator RpaA
MSVYNILVIEDDEIVSRTIERSLRNQDFKVTIASSGVEGLKLARNQVPDLVILDVIMPGMDGYTVCREMRADIKLSAVPVLFLTARIKDEDKITGFKAGADDYLSKPFNIDELILRVRAILRRAGRAGAPTSAGNSVDPTKMELTPHAQRVLEQIQSTSKVLEKGRFLIVGDYVLDTHTYELHTPRQGALRLTPVQYDLLYHLMSHPDQIFTPSRLLDEVWDYPTDAGSPDLVRVHIKNLRERIEPDPSSPSFIRTVPGYGYTVNRDVK